MVVDPKRTGGRAVKSLYHGDYEAPERLIAREMIRPGDKILEAGAGMGLVSLTMARIVGAENVVSYEPMPAAYSLLVDNALLNDLAIDHRPRALSVTNGSVKLYIDANVVASSLYARANSTSIEVDSDGIVETLQTTGANALVLDVEGSEVELIKSSPLTGVEKIIMEIHPHIVGEPAINAMLEHLSVSGFRRNAPLSHGRVLTFLR